MILEYAAHLLIPLAGGLVGNTLGMGIGVGIKDRQAQKLGKNLERMTTPLETKLSQIQFLKKPFGAPSLPFFLGITFCAVGSAVGEYLTQKAFKAKDEKIHVGAIISIATITLISGVLGCYTKGLLDISFLARFFSNAFWTLFGTCLDAKWEDKKIDILSAEFALSLGIGIALGEAFHAAPHVISRVAKNRKVTTPIVSEPPKTESPLPREVKPELPSGESSGERIVEIAAELSGSQEARQDTILDMNLPPEIRTARDEQAVPVPGPHPNAPVPIEHPRVDFLKKGEPKGEPVERVRRLSRRYPHGRTPGSERLPEPPRRPTQDLSTRTVLDMRPPAGIESPSQTAQAQKVPPQETAQTAQKPGEGTITKPGDKDLTGVPQSPIATDSEVQRAIARVAPQLRKADKLRQQRIEKASQGGELEETATKTLFQKESERPTFPPIGDEDGRVLEPIEDVNSSIPAQSPQETASSIQDGSPESLPPSPKIKTPDEHLAEKPDWAEKGDWEDETGELKTSVGLREYLEPPSLDSLGEVSEADLPPLPAPETLPSKESPIPEIEDLPLDSNVAKAVPAKAQPEGSLAIEPPPAPVDGDPRTVQEIFADLNSDPASAPPVTPVIVSKPPPRQVVREAVPLPPRPTATQPKGGGAVQQIIGEEPTRRVVVGELDKFIQASVEISTLLKESLSDMTQLDKLLVLLEKDSKIFSQEQIWRIFIILRATLEVFHPQSTQLSQLRRITIELATDLFGESGSLNSLYMEVFGRAKGILESKKEIGIVKDQPEFAGLVNRFLKDLFRDFLRKVPPKQQ